MSFRERAERVFLTMTLQGHPLDVAILFVPRWHPAMFGDRSLATEETGWHLTCSSKVICCSDLLSGCTPRQGDSLSESVTVLSFNNKIPKEKAT